LLESAKIDGANHMQIFVKVVVPLSVPALASFSIFQFLWIWNDLLVAMFVGPSTTDDIVFPILLERQLGTFGDQLHLLNASAVISMVVPGDCIPSYAKIFYSGFACRIS
jgi:alpha-glucoside transport system permease protein